MAENNNRDHTGSAPGPDDYNAREFEACRMFSRFSDLHSYRLLLNNCRKTVYRTIREIRFSPGFSFGTPYKSFIRRFGPPYDSFVQSEPFNHRILYYKFSLDDQPAACEMHFYNDKLFYFNYTLFNLNAEKKEEVLMLLAGRYLNFPVSMRDTRIIDRNNNIVFVNDILDLTVSYLATRSELFSTLHPRDAHEMEKSCARRNIELIAVL